MLRYLRVSLSLTPTPSFGSPKNSKSPENQDWDESLPRHHHQELVLEYDEHLISPSRSIRVTLLLRLLDLLFRHRRVSPRRLEGGTLGSTRADLQFVVVRSSRMRWRTVHPCDLVPESVPRPNPPPFLHLPSRPTTSLRASEDLLSLASSRQQPLLPPTSSSLPPLLLSPTASTLQFALASSLSPTSLLISSLPRLLPQPSPPLATQLAALPLLVLDESSTVDPTRTRTVLVALAPSPPFRNARMSPRRAASRVVRSRPSTRTFRLATQENNQSLSLQPRPPPSSFPRNYQRSASSTTSLRPTLPLLPSNTTSRVSSPSLLRLLLHPRTTTATTKATSTCVVESTVLPVLRSTFNPSPSSLQQRPRRSKLEQT